MNALPATPLPLAVDPANPPTALSLLRAHTVRVRMVVTQLGLARVDKDASRQIEGGKVVKHVYPGIDPHHRELDKHQRAARDVLDRLALPHRPDEGWRVLPIAYYPEFLRSLNAVRSEFVAALDKLRAAAPPIAAAAGCSVEEIVGAYTLLQRTEDYPPGKFEMFEQMSLPLARKLEQGAEQDAARFLREAADAALSGLHARLDHFYSRMELYGRRPAPAKAPTKGGAKAPKGEGAKVSRAGVFRDTVITNINEYVARMAVWNFAGDDRLAEVQQRLSSFSRIEPAMLRNDAAVRAAVVDRAHEVMWQIDEWIDGFALKNGEGGQ